MTDARAVASARRWSATVRSAAGLMAGIIGAAALTPAFAQQKPLWEFGLGVGALGFRDYRGADTGHLYLLPVPYIVYRGRHVRADRDGVRGLLYDRKAVELNISVNATTPVRSRDSAARHAMPDLRPTLEIGPSLDVHLWQARDRLVRLDLRMPVRGAQTIESSPRFIGWFFAPRLNVDIDDVAGHAGWNLGMLVGPLFASRRYHDYFYRVAPEFATPDRPAYEARAGYSGSQVLVSLSKRMPRYWVGGFARYDLLDGAAFAGSSLVRSHGYWAVGIGIAWMIAQSSTLVDVPDERR